MPYPSTTVANWFVRKAQTESKPLSPMKLQKLVYFAHGWHLAIRQTALINEQVEAWKFGPVIPSLYRAFKRFGSGQVTEFADELFSSPEAELAKLDSDPLTSRILEEVWRVYGKFSAVHLSNLTHQLDTPWARVERQYGGRIPNGTDIPKDDIRDHFVARAQRNKQQ